MLRVVSCLAVFAAALALAPAPVLADAKAEIIASHAAMMTKGKFKVESDISSGSDKTRSSATVVWPDRYHIVNQLAGGQVMEVIVLPGSTYMKQGGQWSRFPMDMSAMIKAFSPDAMTQSQANMTEIEDLGSEAVDGRLARKFRYKTSATVMGIKSSSAVTTWIDDGTDLPIKQQVEGEAMGQKSTTMQTYTFDDALKVEAPL
jgi:hypothetical protein